MNLEVRGPLAASEELRSLVRAAASTGRTVGKRALVDGTRGYLKGSALRSKARVRHAVRGVLLGRSLPRVAELENLSWLREHGFRAPRPLAAGVVRESGGPPWQFLLTEELAGAEPLHRALEGADPDRRREVLAGLGRDVARLHALGFVHRDLYPRNLLLVPDGGPEVWFVDAWRGGARRQLRGPDCDHAALLLHGAAWFTPAEQAAYLHAWLGERGRPLSQAELRRFLERIAAERARLAARFARERRPESRLPAAGPWDADAVLAELATLPEPAPAATG